MMMMVIIILITIVDESCNDVNDGNMAMMFTMATWQENEKRDRRGFLREEQSRSPLCRNLVSPLVMMVALVMIIMVIIIMVGMVIIIVAIKGWNSVRIMIVSYKGSTGSGV